MKFFNKLIDRIHEVDSLLCIGIDPRLEDIKNKSAKSLEDYCLQLIETTMAYAASYKPNIAFFEAFGWEGIKVLYKIREFIPDQIPILLDAKRGDISSTANSYAIAYFDELGVDAITINPYLGRDAIQPFANREDKGVFLLCKTSNPGSSDLQDLMVINNTGGRDVLYERVGFLAQELNINENIGLVIGATQIDALQMMRELLPEMWLLTPGVGAQGGSVEKTITAAIRKDGLGILIPISRGISQSSEPAQSAKYYRDLINTTINESGEKNNLLDRPKVLNRLKKRIAIGLFDTGCIKFGKYKLKSGDLSPIYIDLRRLTSFPDKLYEVASAYIGILKKMEFDHLVGIPYAGLPIATAIGLQGNWSVIYPRKESKDYGTKATLEGVFKRGDRVVMIDDLITTGESKNEVIIKLKNEGLRVDRVVVLVDRRKSKDIKKGNAEYSISSVLNIWEVLKIFEDAGIVSDEQLEVVRKYLNS